MAAQPYIRPTLLHIATTKWKKKILICLSWRLADRQTIFFRWSASLGNNKRFRLTQGFWLGVLQSQENNGLEIFHFTCVVASLGTLVKLKISKQVRKLYYFRMPQNIQLRKAFTRRVLKFLLYMCGSFHMTCVLKLPCCGKESRK